MQYTIILTLDLPDDYAVPDLPPMVRTTPLASLPMLRCMLANLAEGVMEPYHIAAQTPPLSP